MRQLLVVLSAMVVVLSLASLFIAPPRALNHAIAQAPGSAGPTAPDGSMLLTVFLRHDQSKTLGDINTQLKHTGYYTNFPPAGIDVVSWYVMMGIGQVVTLRVPADRLREVNRVLEETAWGSYRTEFYPTYDYKEVAEQERRGAG